MLKITSIVTSLLFLLFVGTGSYARSIVKQEQQAKAATEEKEESSESDDLDGESSQSFDRINVLQAISLVNAQLRWKEFHGDTRRKVKQHVSPKQSFEANELEEVSELLVQPITTADFRVEQNLSISWKLQPAERSNCLNVDSSKVRAKTIAFILNCGTYPHHLS